ncbi:MULTISPECIES: cupin domain-containing protein [unclassified Paracoccus (in: a-proteobacteria)]|uniref:cupin domain-containing protein n=1 Tax=unclassified Paracoccus (in: a-proteobacteria) TaxID=2688777 RepID=UPI0012B18FA8|nr:MULTISPECIES: cupin domain-containing protein [unclassified Paracoccus (in: a-proteobacteria)]UXU74952.1 cupin domain-containing protein [Paracoccus sp. SMMA_5]UXU80855.1 cupin domain-containing protein [Paracoccus sp. SMMA_5_TC]
MPKLDLDAAPLKTGSIYPEPYASQMAGRSSRRLGDLAGLTQFGVNIVTLEPGAVASLRHWHLREDEFAMVLEGDLILVEDEGEVPMGPGDCAAWKAGVANGHRFVNRSDRVGRFLIVGSKAPEEVATYSDVDLQIHLAGGQARFTYHDGSDWTGPRDLSPKGDKA